MLFQVCWMSGGSDGWVEFVWWREGWMEFVWRREGRVVRVFISSFKVFVFGISGDPICHLLCLKNIIMLFQVFWGSGGVTGRWSLEKGRGSGMKSPHVVDQTFCVWDIRRPYLPFAVFEEHHDAATYLKQHHDAGCRGSDGLVDFVWRSGRGSGLRVFMLSIKVFVYGMPFAGFDEHNDVVSGMVVL